MLNYRAVRDWDFGEIEHRYGERDIILYALAAGMGNDPVDEAELRFVYEKRLLVLPSMVTTFGSPGPWWRDPRTGVDYAKNLHAEQDLHLFEAVPTAGRALGRNRVTALHDRGSGRGALAEIERDIVDAASGRLLARSRRIEVLRESGGFSAREGVSDPRPAALDRLPEDPGTPDNAFDMAVSPRTGLFYRLCGDLNPLHVDPETARAAGFPAPILHGLGSFAIACFAMVKAVCGYRAERLSRLAVRFTAPVYPGDVLRFLLWRDGDARVRFRTLVPHRAVTVLDNGIAELRT